MIEFLVFVISLAADQILKYWSMTNLKSGPDEMKPIIEGFLWLFYKENTGENVSFIRGRSSIMMFIRILQVLLVLYLVIFKRDKIKLITRIALMLFLAGLIGNQINYIFLDYVPDMLYCKFFPSIVFNLADVLVFVSMIILFVRMAFFEGQDFITWIFAKVDKLKGITPAETTGHHIDTKSDDIDDNDIWHEDKDASENEFSSPKENGEIDDKP